MNQTPNITINLFGDWAIHLRGLMMTDGQVIDAAWDDEKVVETYYAYAMRFPSLAVRRISRALNFSCPPEHAAGLQEVERKITAGEDIRPHLSLRTTNLNVSDGMLLDWGVYHLHLGTAPHAQHPEFVERTGPLLYCRFTEHEAYFIGILTHSQWANEELIRVLHENWPSSIERYRLKGENIQLTHSITENQRTKLRAGHVNTLVQLEPGIVYAPPGDGFMTNGLPFRARTQTDHAARWFHHREEAIRTSAATWLPRAANPAGNFNFTLRFDASGWYATDTAQGINIPLGSPQSL